MGFGWLTMLLPLVILILLVVGAVRFFGNDGGREPRTKTPREILDERFARGEINREEYEERRKTLNN